MLPIDAIIILGKGVYADGTIPKIVQQEIEQALQLGQPAQSKQSPAIIFSGNYSGLQNNPAQLTEAAAMKRYAVTHGIQPEKIILEEKSEDTISNAIFCKAIIAARGWKHILILCTDLHLARVCFIFNRVYGQDYQISYQATPQILSRRERWHCKHYELIAQVYARWFFRHSWPTEIKAELRYLENHHFMYHRSTLKRWMKQRFKRPAHRQP